MVGEHTHPMLEKPSAQNIAEFENQGQQNENWMITENQLKRLFWKK